MKITSIDYSIGTSSLDIYVSGCKPPHCSGCHNEELWDFNIGKFYNHSTDKYIIDKCNMFNSLIDKILVMGGEPLHQYQDDMMNLLYTCHNTGKDVWLFTRHDLEDVPEQYLKYLDFVKTGMYNENLKGEVEYYGIKLATTNQKVYKLNKTILVRLENPFIRPYFNYISNSAITIIKFFCFRILIGPK